MFALPRTRDDLDDFRRQSNDAIALAFGCPPAIFGELDQKTLRTWLPDHLGHPHDIEVIYANGLAHPVGAICARDGAVWETDAWGTDVHPPDGSPPAGPAKPAELKPDWLMMDYVGETRRRAHTRKNPSWKRPDVDHPYWHRFLRRWFPAAFRRRLNRLLETT